ncbi:hypothetical protein [Mycobacteroides abscessus]|uniref:hypothetical protein n=1 Tax=Mycobacteroides abscessus TaxID=36809 RepID=UPI00266C6727|nr:hypothetical protein [Mycobacteroides abscessus]MDO3331348.1 hypothetical protein [Mycobacteroides abscessus subsp. abscessus]
MLHIKNPAVRRTLHRSIASTAISGALLTTAIAPIAHADTGLTGTVTTETALYDDPATTAPVSTVPAGTPVAIICLTTNDPDPTTGPHATDGSTARWRITYGNQAGYVDTATVLINEPSTSAVRYSC